VPFEGKGDRTSPGRATALRGVGPGWIVIATLLGAAVLWHQSLSPLQRPYGVGAGLDRLHYLANGQVVAAGNSPFETFQLGQQQAPGRPHWIFWSVLVALLSGFEPARVFAIYDLLGLLTALAWPLAVFACLRPAGALRGFSAWEAAMAAFFAGMLVSQPLDLAGPYRDPWTLNFLLKPNHALSLALTPLLLRGFASLSSWPQRLGIAIALHALGWVFLLHLVYVSLGLLAFLGLSWWLRRPDRHAAAVDVGAAIGIGLGVPAVLAGSLLRLGDFLEPSLEEIPAFTPHGLDVTLGSGWLFWAAVLGALVSLRRPGRLGLLLVGQWVAAYAITAAYWPARWLQLVRSVDEIFYWTRFHTAVLAGIGALAAARYAAALLRPRLVPGEPRVAWLLCAALLPHLQPLWWQSEEMDPYHAAALAPLPATLDSATRFLREHTPPEAVVAASPDFAVYVAALGARRVLISDLNPPDDQARRRALFLGLAEAPTRQSVAGARASGVTHLLLTPRSPQELRRLAGYTADRGFERLFQAGSRAGEVVAIYRLIDVSGPAP
jgi:hypothetical protein